MRDCSPMCRPGPSPLLSHAACWNGTETEARSRAGRGVEEKAFPPFPPLRPVWLQVEVAEQAADALARDLLGRDPECDHSR